MQQQVTATEVVKLLAERNLTISAAESLTAGMLMSELAAVPGASKVLMGGFVTYATEFKTKLLGVPAELIAHNGVVSEATATAMATACRQQTGTSIAVGLTGVAGPAALAGQAVGTVWIGVASATNQLARLYQFDSTWTRSQIRQAATMGALQLVHELLFD